MQTTDNRLRPTGLGQFQTRTRRSCFSVQRSRPIGLRYLYHGLKESLAPEGALEEEMLKELVDDRWRMNRATSLESPIFAEGAEKYAESSEATGDPDIDLALSEGRLRQAEAKNLSLLSLYTSCFHRRFERNMAELRRLRPSAMPRSGQAIGEAALLSHMAKTKGKTYNIAEAFTRRNFVTGW